MLVRFSSSKISKVQSGVCHHLALWPLIPFLPWMNSEVMLMLIDWFALIFNFDLGKWVVRHHCFHYTQAMINNFQTTNPAHLNVVFFKCSLEKWASCRLTQPFYRLLHRNCLQTMVFCSQVTYHVFSSWFGSLGLSCNPSFTPVIIRDNTKG